MGCRDFPGGKVRWIRLPSGEVSTHQSRAACAAKLVKSIENRVTLAWFGVRDDNSASSLRARVRENSGAAEDLLPQLTQDFSLHSALRCASESSERHRPPETAGIALWTPPPSTRSDVSRETSERTSTQIAGAAHKGHPPYHHGLVRTAMKRVLAPNASHGGVVVGLIRTKPATWNFVRQNCPQPRCVRSRMAALCTIDPMGLSVSSGTVSSAPQTCRPGRLSDSSSSANARCDSCAS